MSSHSQTTEMFHQSFWRAFDMSKCLQLIPSKDSAAKATTRLEFLGEGSHFAAYRFNEPGSSGSIVIKIANERFQRQLAGGGIQRWIKRINDLGTAQLPLVPPMQAFMHQDRLVTCLPFGTIHAPGDEVVSDSDVNALRTALSQRDLIIKDSLQIRWWQSVPFVCDFSDLKHREHGY